MNMVSVVSDNVRGPQLCFIPMEGCDSPAMS